MVDGIVWFIFAIYLVAMKTRRGQTLGDRLLKIRVIGIDQPDLPGVPLWRILLRYASMLIGAIPALAVGLYAVVVVGDMDALVADGFFHWIWPAIGICLIWGVILVIQVSMKRDPVYDRLAGTAVIRYPHRADVGR